MNPILEVIIAGHAARLTPQQISDELVYVSYKTNRDLAPEITPEQWANPRAFGPQAVAMEARYQKEKSRGACGISALPMSNS